MYCFCGVSVMARGKTLKVAFKSNNQNQAMLMTPDLNDLIAANHPVCVVAAVMEKTDVSVVVRQYKPGGTSSYHGPPQITFEVVSF